MSARNCSNIDPNPDISGIGVRTAIYAQAVLTLVQPLLAGLDGEITEEELGNLHLLYLGILMPGCALLLSAIIQTKTFDLSVYHAMLVLNLSWINNTSALIFFQFSLIAQIKLEKAREFRNNVGKMMVFLFKVHSDAGAQQDAATHVSSFELADEGAMRMRAALRLTLPKEERRKVVSGMGVLKGSADVLGDVMTTLTALRGAGKSPEEVKSVFQVTQNRLRNPRFGRALGIESAQRGRLWPILEKWAKHIGATTLVNLLERDFTMAALTSAHLTLMSAFGMWFWFTIKDRSGYCQEVTTHNFFASIPVTSPGLRDAFLAIYILSTIPIVNVMLFGLLELIVVYIISLMRYGRRTSRNPAIILGSDGRTVLFSFVGLTLVAQIYFIVTTELTIHYNAHLLPPSTHENEWTFGQTLAVALVTIPIVQVYKEVRREITRRKEMRGS